MKQYESPYEGLVNLNSVRRRMNKQNHVKFSIILADRLKLAMSQSQVCLIQGRQIQDHLLFPRESIAIVKHQQLHDFLRDMNLGYINNIKNVNLSNNSGYN